MLKKILKPAAVLLLAVLLLGGLILSASGSATIYLMSVNNRVFVMTEENMPVMSGGQVYIPYTMVSEQFTGIDLGVNARYSTVRGTLTVTDGVNAAIFDVKKSNSYDLWGNPLQAKALVRNAMVYIPVQWLCSFFKHLNYSLVDTPYGILVRLTDSDDALPDAMFVDAADDQLRKNWQDYQNAIATPSVPTVTPTPTPTPPPPPTVAPDPEPIPEVCLALDWGTQIGRAADLLEAEGRRALFLLDSAKLMQQDDLVRRLVARGHQIGLVIYGKDMDDCLRQLEKGRQLLRDISRSAVLIVSADELKAEGLQRLREEGCAIWSDDWQADGKEVSELLERLDTDTLNCVELTCDYAGVQLLAELISREKSGEISLRQALAPLL